MHRGRGVRQRVLTSPAHLISCPSLFSSENLSQFDSAKLSCRPTVWEAVGRRRLMKRRSVRPCAACRGGRCPACRGTRLQPVTGACPVCGGGGACGACGGVPVQGRRPQPCGVCDGRGQRRRQVWGSGVTPAVLPVSYLWCVCRHGLGAVGFLPTGDAALQGGTAASKMDVDLKPGGLCQVPLLSAPQCDCELGVGSSTTPPVGELMKLLQLVQSQGC